jgi:hypothetical protein
MTDEVYRAWLQTQPSCLTGNYSEYLEDGRRLCIAAHIRRAGQSGVGYKAPFACVPLTQTEHLHQHQFGELSCLRRFTRDPQLICTLDDASPFEAERIAGEWFDAQVEKYVSHWRRLDWLKNGLKKTSLKMET